MMHTLPLLGPVASLSSQGFLIAPSLTGALCVAPVNRSPSALLVHLETPEASKFLLTLLLRVSSWRSLGAPRLTRDRSRAPCNDQHFRSDVVFGKPLHSAPLLLLVLGLSGFVTYFDLGSFLSQVNFYFFSFKEKVSSK